MADNQVEEVVLERQLLGVDRARLHVVDADVLRVAQADLDHPGRDVCSVGLVHEPCLLQHGQMLGDRRPRHVEVRGDLAGRELLVPHEPEDPAPVRGGDRLQRRFHWPTM